MAIKLKIAFGYKVNGMLPELHFDHTKYEGIKQGIIDYYSDFKEQIHLEGGYIQAVLDDRATRVIKHFPVVSPELKEEIFASKRKTALNNSGDQ